MSNTWLGMHLFTTFTVQSANILQGWTFTSRLVEPALEYSPRTTLTLCSDGSSAKLVDILDYRSLKH